MKSFLYLLIVAVICGFLWHQYGSGKTASQGGAGKADTSVIPYDRSYAENIRLDVSNVGVRSSGMDMESTYSIKVHSFRRREAPITVEVFTMMGIKPANILKEILQNGKSETRFRLNHSNGKRSQWYARAIQDNRVVGIAVSVDRLIPAASRPTQEESPR